MQVLVGTSGYSYKEWKGSFYPKDLKAAAMLRYYAERLPTVEINNTFYRMPKAAVLQNWAAQVPAGFVFVLKGSQRITHCKRLKDAGERVGYLFETAARWATSWARCSSSSLPLQEGRGAAARLPRRPPRGAAGGLRVPARELVRRRGV